MSSDLHSRVEDLHRKIERLDLKALAGADRNLSGLLSDLRHLLEEVMIAHEELLSRGEEIVKTREAEEAQRYHYQEVFDKAPECHILTDTSGNITEANLAALNFLNAPIDHIKGKPISAYIPEDCRQSFDLGLERLSKFGDILRWKGQISPSGSHHIPVAISASPLFSQDGDPGGLLWIIRESPDQSDCSALTGSGDEMLEAEKRRSDDLAAQADRRAEELDAIFDAINEPVIIYDLTGSPVRSNFAAIFAFGLDPSRPENEGGSKKPVLVYPDGRIVPGDDLPSTRALRGEVVKGEKYTLIDHDCRKKVITVTATPIASGTTIFGAVAVWHDITEVDGLARELQLERERLVAVLRQMPSGVIIAEAPTGKLIMGNNKVRHIWRHPFMPAESIEGYSVYRGFHHDGRPYMPEEWPLARSIIKGEVVIGEEIDILRGDGTRGTISMSSSPIFDKNADVRSAVATINDITGHRRMVAALRERESQYKLLFESANDGVLLYELQSDGTPGMFVHANGAICRMLGYTPEEVRLLSLQDIQDHKGREHISDEAERILSGQRLSAEDELIGKDGRRISAEISSSVFDLNGKRLVLAIVRDITERKKIEDELKLSRDSLAQSVREGTAKLESAVKELTESEERYKCLVEHSPEPIALMVKGRFAYANPAAVELLCGSRGEGVVGRKVMDFISPGHRVYARSIERKIKKEGSAGPEELKIILASGTSIDVEVTCVKILYQGKPAILVLAKDLTMRKRAMAAVQSARQAAESAARVKFEFLEGVSHEIRTPMNSIMGMTSLLMCTDLDPDQRRYAETIHSSSDSLLSVVNEILDFSKIEEGSLGIEMQPFNLLSCIEDSMDLIASEAAEKGLEMAHNIKAPECIIGDVTHLRQALFYILSNAVKFTNRGEILVSAEDHEVEDGRHEIHFSIKDTGIGISKSQLSRLFKPFGIMGSSSSGYGGLGLGLAISKGIVEAMGGTIWAESAPGAGSTFHFTVVAEACTNALGASSALPGIEGKNVLVINGCSTVREHLTRLIVPWGVTVSKAASAVEALGLMENEMFDAALIDVILPDMDSSYLASEMRRNCPGIYLVAVSHNTPEQGGVFDTFLTKPIRSTRLVEALQGLGNDNRKGDPIPDQTCSMKILVAEDNIVNQKVVLLMLGRLGYTADVVANGREALEALEQKQYDLMLMDLKMPQLNGFEATKEILRRWPESRPRIIAMTAYALKGDRERCMEAGMDDYISKPISVEELRMALQRCRQ